MVRLALRLRFKAWGSISAPARNVSTIAPKLAVIGAQLLQEALTGWMRGEITPLEQDERQASYYSQVKKEEGEIDWSRPAVEIWRRIRAFQPWPGSYTTWKGKQLKINEAMPVKEPANGDPGTIIALEDNGVGIVTGEGVLKITGLQYEGKRSMHTHAFIQGQRDFIGSRLPS